MAVIILLSLGFVLITSVIWCYLRLIGPYLKLPSSCTIFVNSILFCINSLLRREYAEKNVLQTVKEMCRECEKEGLFVSWLGQPMVIVFGPKFVKQIMNEPSANHKPSVYNVFKWLLSNSIFLSSGEEYTRQKRIIKQAFHFGLKEKKIKIFNKHSRNLVKALSSIPNNTTNEILDILRHSAILIIFESMYGIEKSFTERSLIIETLKEVSSFAVERFYKFWLYPDFSLNIFPEGRKRLKQLKTCQGMLLQLMETLKENILSSNKNVSVTKPGLIGEVLLIEYLKDPSLTMDELNEQLMFLIVATFDTTSLTLMWCLYLLGLHEEAQQKVLLEVEKFNEDLCDEDLRKMEYTECVIRESLRMYTTAPILFKYLIKEVHCGNYTIPKGSTVVLPLFMLHKNSDMFPEPEKFYPERFMQTKIGDSSQMYTASFAEGLRPCLGKRDALNQLKIMLAYVVQNFKVISLDKQKDVEVSYECLLIPLKPLRMQFIPRCLIKDKDVLSTAKI